MNLLELAGVSAGYRSDNPVITEINLSLQEGAFLGLIGPNGCGKSTLIRAMSGVLPLAAGLVRRWPSSPAKRSRAISRSCRKTQAALFPSPCGKL